MTDSSTDTAPVRLTPGEPAPEFTLPDADGTPVSLSSYRGRRVIVYCYPAALTPGCRVGKRWGERVSDTPSVAASRSKTPLKT